jgi:hypothetical protein
MDLSPSLSSGSQIVVSSGALALPTGIVVVETEETTLEIGGSFPPSVATDYTVLTRHTEANVGLIGGDAMSYYVTVGLVDTQPSDGVILGWIKHPGGAVSLDSSHIIGAPKYAPCEIAKDYALRSPIYSCPPDLISQISGTSGIFETSGFSTKLWKGFGNTTVDTDPTTLAVPVVVCYYQYPVFVRPYQISLESIIPIGDSIAAVAYDTTGTAVASSTFTAHPTFTVDSLSIPTATGTWVEGSLATLRLTITVAKNTTVQLANLLVDFWPYAIPRF